MNDKPTNIPPYVLPKAIIPGHRTLEDANPEASPALFVTEINIGLTAVMLSLPQHNHLMLANVGLSTILYSSDNQTFFNWLTASTTYILDGHREQRFYLKTLAGTTSLQLTSWTG